MRQQTPDIDQETGLPVMIPGMKQVGPQAPAQDKAEARERLRLEMAAKGSKQGAPQPLATRHLDPNYNPAIRTDIGPRVQKTKVMVRAGYMLYVGKNDAFKGPCVCWLTDEEMKGQEHKLEILEGTSRQMSAHATPQAISDDQTEEILAAQIRDLKSKLEVLEVELAERRKKRGDVDETTIQAPEENPDAKATALTSETPIPDGGIQGPEHNPDAEGAKSEPKKGGRPKGARASVTKTKTS